MPNYFLTLAYDGSDFHGWQSQPDARTVQDVLESAVATLFEPGIRATAAGRTDAGVHALALPVNFIANGVRPPETVVRALNAILPDDVQVCDCRVVSDGFSARYDAKSRTYRYEIECGPLRNPMTRRCRWRIPVELDAESVQNAMSALVGEHDFSSFRSAGCVARTPVRRMIRADLFTHGGGRFDLLFEADGFLRGMVRSIVGTLVQIGRGERPPSDMKALLDSPNRDAAGVTAPPHGLYFVSANYPELF